MLMKPSASRESRAEAADVHVAVAVHLRKAETSKVQPPAVIKIELEVHVQQAVHVGRRPEIHAPRGDTAD